MSIRVLLVDDQPLIRGGFAMILSAEPDMDVVGQAADGAQSVAMIAETTPDVVLMDVQMPVLDGISATRQIVAESDAKVLILTTFDRDDYLFDALQAGASGFLLKNAEPDDLIDAIRTVAGGQALLAPEVTGRVIGRMVHESTSQVSVPRDPRLDQLTDRECDVLTLLGRGMSNAEIAATLFVGDSTIKTHVSNLLAKIGVRDRLQAVVFAYETGLIRPGKTGA